MRYLYPLILCILFNTLYIKQINASNFPSLIDTSFSYIGDNTPVIDNILIHNANSLLPPWSVEGSAEPTTLGCLEGFQLTTAVPAIKGCVWDTEAIDFSADDIDHTVMMNFGNLDVTGADGICLVYKSSPDGCGTGGGGIGASGLPNSFIIEFDTWDNGVGVNDIPDDHVAVSINGNLSAPIAGPISLGNIEDGMNHEVRFVWNAGSQTYEIYFDGSLKISGSFDIASLFGGGIGYCGFTASTGGAVNNQSVFPGDEKGPPPPPEFDDFDQEVCENQPGVIYSVVEEPGISYHWSAPPDATIIGDGSSTVQITFGSQSGEVCVTADNGCGISSEICVYVTVIPLPDVEVVQPPVICDDHYDLSKVILLGLLPTQGISYFLNLKDATNGYPVMNPTIVYTSGTYYVRIETTKECFIVLPIDISFEILQISVNGPKPICSPGVINLPNDISVTDYYGNDISYLSFYQTQAFAFLGTPQLNSTIIDKSGIFWVRAQTVNGCFDVAPITVVIQEKPEIEITTPSIKCLGDTLDLTTIIVKDTAGIINDSLTSNYYFSYIDAQKDTNRISPPFIWNSDTVWVRSKTSAGCYDIESVFIQFLPAPIATISGSGFYCNSDSAVINVNFVGIAPYKASFTDGVTVFNINQNTDEYTLKVPVKSQISYVLISYSENSGAACPPVLQGKAEFNLFEEPVVKFNVPKEACNDSLIQIGLSSDKNWPVQLDYLFNTNQGSIGILNGGSYYSGVLSAPGIFKPLSIKDVNGCHYKLGDSFNIKINTPPLITNIQEKCMGTDFIVSFTITSNDPSSVKVNGSKSGISGNQFTSGLLASKTNYSFMVEDSFGCGPVILTGYKNCDCQTFAGTMQLSTLDICVNGTKTAVHNGDQFLDSNDGLVFILHDSPGANPGNIIAINNNPVFYYDATKMQTEKLYYISSLAGNQLTPGQIDLNDPCLSVSPGTPVIFHDLPEVSFLANDTICLGKEANLNLNASGNFPFILHIFKDGMPYLNPTINNTTYIFKDSPLFDKLYTVSISDKYCDNLQLDSATVHVNESPKAINIKHLCNPNNLNYTVSFDIIGGDPLSYKVTNIAGVLSGNHFISQSMAVNQSYNIFIDDKFGCGPFVVAGSYDCKCETSAGTINTPNIIACIGDTIQLIHSGEFLDGNDLLQVIVSKNIKPDFSEIVFNSDKGSIWFNSTLMVPGIKYYIKIIAGNQITGINQIDPNDPCISYSNFIELTFNESPQFIIQAIDTIYTTCDQFQLTLESSPFYSANNYINKWSTDIGNILGPPSNTSISVDKNGTYYLSVTDTLGGCSSAGKLEVNIISEIPIIKAIPDATIGCTIKKVFLDATGSSYAFPFKVKWSTNDGNIVSAMDQLKVEIDQPGSYIIQIENIITACVITDTIVVSSVKELDLEEISIKNPDCPKTSSGNIIITSISGGLLPYTYKLSNGSQNTNGLFNYLKDGVYTLNIQDANGCLFDTIITLKDPEPLQIDIGPDITVEWGEIVQLNAQINVPFNEIDTLIWTNVDSANCNFCLSPNYIAKQSNIIKAKVSRAGCASSDDMRVIVEKSRHVFIPNVFSPNSDGINDKLYIFGDKKVSIVKSFVIYDRWGEQVFESHEFTPDGQSGGWDGKFKGKYMNTQVLVYYALVQFIDGDTELYRGDITLTK